MAQEALQVGMEWPWVGEGEGGGGGCGGCGCGGCMRQGKARPGQGGRRQKVEVGGGGVIWDAEASRKAKGEAGARRDEGPGKARRGESRQSWQGKMVR